MLNKRLTILITTFNEKDRLDLIIKRYSEYAEIILLDNHSEDGTIELARNYGIKVVKRRKKGGLEIGDIISGVEIAGGEWIHLCGCSEVLTDGLLKKIRLLIDANKYDAIAIGRKSYTWGFNTHYVKYGYQQVGCNIEDNFRFINKHKIDWNKSRIHFETPGTIEKNRVKFLTEDDENIIHHFREGNPYLINEKHALYSDMEAKSIFKNNNVKNKNILIKIFFSPLKRFLLDFYQFPTVGGFISAICNAQLVLNIQMTLYILNKFGYEYNIENEKLRKRFESLCQNE